MILKGTPVQFSSSILKFGASNVHRDPVFAQHTVLLTDAQDANRDAVLTQAALDTMAAIPTDIIPRSSSQSPGVIYL
jgi:hypothetical protein